jgi:uncharacterized protein YcfJ
MQAIFKPLLAATVAAFAAQVGAQVVFYTDDNFGGQSFTAERSVNNFKSYGFNDRASSVVVLGNRWEVCEDAGYSGNCRVLRQGRYPSLASMGLNDRVSSVRAVGSNANVPDDRYAPAPAITQDYRRRSNERLYEANVTSVRAVVGPDEQRCWVEGEQVQSSANIHPGGAIVGGLLGGILGHQIGGGFGRDIATAGGVVAGAVVGSRTEGRMNDRRGDVQPVQRCSTAPQSATPAYWDVTYNFRGLEHRVQLNSRPGRTVTVNRDGEPRV